ncbi:zinc-binding dehydrogenase [Streptomyces sp. NPDC002920]
MKAMVLRELGGPRGLSPETLPDPEPGEGEVVVRLRTAALNRRDLFITYGQYPGVREASMPYVLGSDGTGEVVATGGGVSMPAKHDVIIDPTLGWGTDLRSPGQSGISILGMPDHGTFAELVKVPAANVHPKPAHLTTTEAAALPLGALTAYRAVITRGEVGAGDTVLVPGIGSGTATLCLQIAQASGAQVFVTSSSEEKLDAAKRLGAVGGVNYTNPGWVRELKELSGGVDVVIDAVGGKQFADNVRLIRIGGRIVSFGSTAGSVPELLLPHIFLKHIDVLGTAMGSPMEFAKMLDFFSRHQLRPLVTRQFPLEDARAGLELMESGASMGKIVLDIRS